MIDREDQNRSAASEELAPLLELLRMRRGHDFSSYKAWAVRGRVQRRMAMRGVAELHEYERLVRTDSMELSALYGDLLIGVTSFFRDADAFESFARVLTDFVAADPHPLRIWVPGCSTGEEAYSIAILLQEHALDGRIFATDIDAAAIERGRTGWFVDIEADVAPARLARWFDPEGGGFVIARTLRDRVVFGTHDLFTDPPFTKLDVVSCRNVLIYLDEQRQDWLLRMLHFTLHPGGLLFLGSSESLGTSHELFEPVDPAWRIYRRRAGTPATVPAPHVRPPRSPEPLLLEALAARFVPPSIITDSDGVVVYAHGELGSVFASPRHDSIYDLVPGVVEVVVAARAHLASAAGELVVPGVSVGEDTFDIHVHAVEQPTQLHGLYAVVFVRARGLHSAIEPRATHWAALERELRTARDDQRGIVDRLRRANEELMSTNERLETAKEELETTKEELAMINAELRVLNAELARRMTDNAQAAQDLANIVTQMDIGVVMLDGALRLKSYTDRVRRLWPLAETDRGRSIGDLVPPDLARQLDEVLHTLQPRTLGITTDSGTHFVIKVGPYRASDHAIEGLVLVIAEGNGGEGAP